MAAKKRPKRKPIRHPKALPTTPTTQQGKHSTIIQPSFVSSHTRHKAHPLPAGPSSTPLGKRFHALPPELRAHIFSLLLVQPVKWFLPHSPSCTVLPGSYPPCRPEPNTCANCRYFFSAPQTFRHRPPDKPWMHPYRSVWAPEVANEFLCSTCWDEQHRASVCGEPFPRLETWNQLPCLCARRRDLGIRLVCRRWHHEASHVFYSRNTFAFEHGQVFTDFMANLPARWRECITSVSLKALQRPEDAFAGQELETKRTSAHIVSYFRRLPALGVLELDKEFLMHEPVLRALLKLGRLNNLRQVRFLLCKNGAPKAEGVGNELVYPHLATPTLLVGGLAEAVGRALKGEHARCLKRSGEVERAIGVLKEVVREHAAERARGVGNGEGGGFDEVLDCSDWMEWARLWEAGGRKMHYVYAGAAREEYYAERERRLWRKKCEGVVA